MIVKYNEDGTPNIWAVKQTQLTVDECIEKIVDGVVKRLKDKDEIVRCKDCKYWHRLRTVKRTVKMCTRTMPAIRTTEDDFCSRGEKKTKVVFCKDCIYWSQYRTKDKLPVDLSSRRDNCDKFGVKVKADDFCNKGEKKDE